MVAGDLVNTASRLQSAAPRRAPCSSARRPSAPRTRRIAFEPAGEQALKGKAAPVPRLACAARRGRGGGRNRTEGLEAPFVGRDDELRLLKDLFHATARDERAATRLGDRPGGIGKSRLAWEFRSTSTASSKTRLLARRPLPVLRRGRHVLGAGRDGPRAAPSCRGRRRSHDARQDRGDGSPVACRTKPSGAGSRPRCSPLLGLGEPPAGGRDELFAAWRTFFERIAEQGTPVSGVRGPPVGGQRAARLHRPPARLDARRCRSSW